MKLADFFIALGVEVEQAQFSAAERALHNLENTFDGIRETWSKIPEMAKGVAIGELLADGIRGGIQLVKEAIEELPRQVIQAVEVTREWSVEMVKLSAQTGLSVQRLQELHYIADRTKVPMTAMTHAVMHLDRALLQAKMGSQQTALAFSQVGLSVNDARLKDPNEALGVIVEKLGAITDESKRTGLAMMLLGRSGYELGPLWKESAASLAAMAARAREFGAVASDELIAKGKALDNSFVDLHAAVTGLRFSISGPLLDGISGVVEGIAQWVSVNREWISTDVSTFVKGLGALLREFLPSVAAVTTVLHVLGTGLKLVGVAFSFIAKVLHPIMHYLRPLLELWIAYKVQTYLAAAAQWAFNAAAEAAAWKMLVLGLKIDAVQGGLWGVVRAQTAVIARFTIMAGLIAGTAAMLTAFWDDWNDKKNGMLPRVPAALREIFGGKDENGISPFDMHPTLTKPEPESWADRWIKRPLQAIFGAPMQPQLPPGMTLDDAISKGFVQVPMGMFGHGASPAASAAASQGPQIVEKPGGAGAIIIHQNINVHATADVTDAHLAKVTEAVKTGADEANRHNQEILVRRDRRLR